MTLTGRSSGESHEEHPMVSTKDNFILDDESFWRIHSLQHFSWHCLLTVSLAKMLRHYPCL